MECTFKSIKPDGTVAYSCDLVATMAVDPALVDACNAYWASTSATLQWKVDPAHVCAMHATNFSELNEILKEGDFDRIAGTPSKGAA